MTNTTVIAVLPVGEFDTNPIKSELEAITRAVNRLGAQLVVADPVADQESACQSVRVLAKRNPDLLLIIPSRGLSAQVIEAAALTSAAPCLIWPVQGRFALPSSALAVGALREAKVPVELLYAPPDLPDSVNRLLSIMKAARALSRLRKSRIGVVGGLFPNLVSCRYDPQMIRARLGIILVPISFDALRSHIATGAGAEQIRAIEESRREISRSYKVGAADGNVLDVGIKLHLALKLVALEQELDGFATECWSAFPGQLGANPCLGFIEDDYTLACEGDVMLSASLLIVRYLTGAYAYVGDLYDLDLDGILTLAHCGAPASLAADKKDVLLGKSQLALDRGFETLTCRPKLAPGHVTLLRLYGMDCDKLHLASGELISCEQSPNLTIKVKLDADRWDFLDQCFGNHYLVAAADIRSELKLLCKWLGIAIFET
jgi:L-fucose isomerase-like protein